jgi:hypothetical protein
VHRTPRSPLERYTHTIRAANGIHTIVPGPKKSPSAPSGIRFHGNPVHTRQQIVEAKLTITFAGGFAVQ